MRIWIALLLIVTLSSPVQFFETANAETAQAPMFLLDVSKAVEGKVTLTMSGKNIVNVYGYEAVFSYDPDKLELLGAKSNMDGFSVSPIIKNNKITIAHTKIGSVAGDSGNMTIGTLTFKLKKHGETTVKWESMKVVTDQSKSTLTSVGKSVSMGKAFIDLVGHWAQADIELLASMGIIDGMDENHFVPEAKVTRAQFAAMISRALTLKATADPNPFTDVPADSWYAGVVSSAYTAGIIKGRTDSSFAPEQDVTREEMTVMLMRAGRYASAGTFEEQGSLGAVGGIGEIPFADAHSFSEWAIKDIQIAVREGIINGRSDNRFVPKSQASRAEAAVVIKRLLSKRSSGDTTGEIS
ncbi:S-layer homology domain-containing protein [Paenibacillus eucommiae]|uniref:SLH domain-containing protein n=1 Tax=Paenibacillus eucommiae TaxID=1355755 RepID=A0ABS4IZG1_9BACL|nr:S-layer homology domain-containing protein [Paenibacillus eucommiae]MBP1992455.1 hypothetical protein [Paenibacillus eucommiae]